MESKYQGFQPVSVKDLGACVQMTSVAQSNHPIDVKQTGKLPASMHATLSTPVVFKNTVLTNK